MAEGEQIGMYKCASCSQMIDSSKLSRKPVFCQPCEQEYFKDRTDLSPVEKNICDSLSMKNLSTSFLETTTPASLKCDRAACEGQLAVVYCPNCPAKLCATHEQSHETHFGADHRVVSIADYAEPPGKYMKRLPVCKDHNEILIKACRRCDRIICAECDRLEEGCVGSSSHQFLMLSTLKDDTKLHYDILEKQLSDRTAEIKNLEKVTWGDLYDVEEDCRKKMEEIDRIKDEQISKITLQAEQFKEEVQDYQKEVTDQVVDFTSRLMTKREKVEGLCTRIISLNKKENEYEKILQKRDITEEIETLIQPELGICERKRKLDIISKGLQTNLHVDLIHLPTSLTLHSVVNVGSSCYSAYYREDGTILIGSQEGAQLYNAETKELKKYEPALKAVNSVIWYHHIIYILHRVGDVCKVETCLPADDLTQRQQLFEFAGSTKMAGTLSVSEKYIIAKNPDIKWLILYDIVSKQTRTIRPEIYPKALHFLPDGDLLGVGGGKLIKYHLEDEELTVVWRCEDVEGGYGVSAGSDGLIYVCSDKTKTVYIVSPEGKHLQTLTSEKLPSSVGYISVGGDKLIVPGWGNKKIYILTINRKTI